MEKIRIFIIVLIVSIHSACGQATPELTTTPIMIGTGTSSPSPSPSAIPTLHPCLSYLLSFRW